MDSQNIQLDGCALQREFTIRLGDSFKEGALVEKTIHPVDYVDYLCRLCQLILQYVHNDQCFTVM